MGTVYNSFLGHSHHHSSSSVSPSPQQKKSYTLPRRSSSAPSRLSSLNSQLPVQRKRKPSTMNNSVGQVLNSVVHLPRKLVCGRDDPSSPVAHTSEKRSAAPSRSSAGSELLLDKRSLVSSSRKGSYESSCGPDSRPVTPLPTVPTNTPTVRKWNAVPIMSHEDIIRALSDSTFKEYMQKRRLSIAMSRSNEITNEQLSYKPLFPPSAHFERCVDGLTSRIRCPPNSRASSPPLEGIPFRDNASARGTQSRDSSVGKQPKPSSYPKCNDIFCNDNAPGTESPFSRPATPELVAEVSEYTTQDGRLPRVISYSSVNCPTPCSPLESMVLSPPAIEMHDSLCRLIEEKCIIKEGEIELNED